MFIIPQSLGQESGAAYLVPVIYAFYYQGVSRAMLYLKVLRKNLFQAY